MLLSVAVMDNKLVSNMLFHTPELDPRELAVVGQIDELRERLGYLLHEPRRWQGSLRRVSMARAIQGSNSIEGYEAPLDDAAAVDLGEEPLDAELETKLALRGYRDAMTYVLQLVGENRFEYSEQLVKSLHFMMTGYDLKTRPGLWRLGSIYVRDEAGGDVVYRGPDIELVPALMEDLVLSLNAPSDVPTLVRAGMAHLNLVMIHPFRDGNGRMARCLQTLVIAREGVLFPLFSSIEEYLGRNTRAYYDVLALVGQGAWHQERDARPWVRFVLTAHLRQAQTMLRRVKETEQLWNELEALLHRRGLPPRAITGLYMAAMSFRVRNATYRANVLADEGELTVATAGRDLQQLVAAGLLISHGEKRGRYYTASKELAALRQGIIASRDPRDDSDPFAESAPTSASSEPASSSLNAHA